MNQDERVIPLRGREVGPRRRLDVVSFLNREAALGEGMLHVPPTGGPLEDSYLTVLARERQRFLAGESTNRAGGRCPQQQTRPLQPEAAGQGLQLVYGVS